MLFINKGMLFVNTELIFFTADLLFVTAGIKRIPTLGLKDVGKKKDSSNQIG